MASLAMNHILERIALFRFNPTHCVQARAMLGWSVERYRGRLRFRLKIFNALKRSRMSRMRRDWRWLIGLRHRGWCSFPGLQRGECEYSGRIIGSDGAWGFCDG